MATKSTKYFINFNPEQLNKIGNAYKNKTEVTLNITKDQLLENGVLSIKLTKFQVEKLLKGKNEIKFSKTDVQSFGKKVIKLQEKHGGFLPILAALAPFLAKAATFAIPAATGIYGAIANKKHNDRMLAESQRQTNILQNVQGKGMRLTKRGTGMRLYPSNLKKI
jgi:hypothetical protein